MAEGTSNVAPPQAAVDPPRWAPPAEPEVALGLADQIAELKRELALRESVFPGFVARSRMSAAEADKHYNRMRAALRTLLWLQRSQGKTVAIPPLAAGAPQP